ncbi:sensor histidine kinase [Sporosarcina siberiensis]|uniref:histidine kinase n=1 Tax=Sporosarcina siberiensis TaxID=1365606 RepID=A0ABW4SER1_9BACL
MFVSYIRDVKSWILFYIISLALANGVIWLDQGISVETSSILYFNLLLILIFMLFVLWRYHVEMKFVKKMLLFTDEPPQDWHEMVPESKFVRDEIIKNILQQSAVTFSKELRSIQQMILMESDYTAAWVHEVKAPLTAMKLTMEAYRDDPSMWKIEKEWLRIHLLIDQQLYISRLTTLEADFILETTSVLKLVREEIREIRSWCMEKNIGVEFEGDDREVVTDVKWCRFIIRQLLTNAVKYSPNGSDIGIVSSVNSNGNVVLSIQDEGPGIQAHDLPRIFDKGFTGSTGRIHNAATGLGLYLAQMVSEKMGISITAKSGIGNGTEMQMMFSVENEFDQTLK